MKIMPYKRHSKSCRNLRYLFRDSGSQLKMVHPDLTPKGRGLVINWGCSKSKPNASCTFINKPEKVKVAINKLETFNVLKAANVCIPEFTTSFEEAKSWIEDDYIVLMRSKLESHSGNGIKVCHEVSELLPGIPLYVRYYRKKFEFRVHVFNGQVIDFVQKKKRSGISESMFNKYIRSYDNGWVFCRDEIENIPEIKTEAVKAVQALGLDFGAVDIIWTKGNKAMVLEINTSPALEGSTIQSYKQAIESLTGSRV